MLKSTYQAAAEKPLPEGWTEHTAPSGHKYYYNPSTKQSTYTRPAISNDEPLQIDFNATEPDYEIKASLLAQDEFHKNSTADPRGRSHFTGGASYQTHSRRRGHGGDRPKSKAAITNCSPWLLVKTKFGRRFVHNTETKQSLWKFPQDVMMAVIEMDRMEWEAKREKENAPEQVQRPEPARPVSLLRAEQEDDDSDSYEEVEVTDSEGENAADPNKRPRLSPTLAAPAGPVEYDEDDIEWQLAQMEDYDDANSDHQMQEEDDEGLPLTDEDNIALFRSLLDDFRISPYSTFEKILEDSNLIEDERYTALPNMHRRREVFVDWSRDRVAELSQLQAEQGQKADPRIEYLRFLQHHASTKLFWPEFKRKYRKEDVMKAYEMSEKEREKLYREYVSKMKMGEAEKRRELLACLKGPGKGLTRRSPVAEMPETVLRDVRFYLMHEQRRDEVLEDFLSTLPD